MYNSKCYLYILSGSEKQIEIGREVVKDISLPNGYSVHDNLLFQIGSAKESGDTNKVNGLIDFINKQINEMKYFLL
jgi:hypothetical protein